MLLLISLEFNIMNGTKQREAPGEKGFVYCRFIKVMSYGIRDGPKPK